MEAKSLFDALNGISCNNHTEKKEDLTYLSWAWAWGGFRKVCPKATYIVHKDENGNPFHKTEEGYMVWTTVNPGAPWDEEPLDMWLPVMDDSNKTAKHADMMQINKTIMRCLTKNISMFGLGLYIYAGEDLPDECKVNNKTKEKAIRLGIKLDDLATYNKLKSKDDLTEQMIQKAIDLKEQSIAKRTTKGLPTPETVVIAKTVGYSVEQIAAELRLANPLELTDEMARQFIKERSNGDIR